MWLTSAGPKSLLRMQRELSDDLIASDFDIARTLALMIHSPAFQRTVPDVLQPQTSLMASQTQLQQAHKLVDAYAAAPAQSSIGMIQKIAHVLRASGLKIDLPGGDSAMLGQVADEEPKQKSRRRLSEGQRSRLPVDFPTDVDSPPVAWLDQVGELDAKLEHLAYLAGRSGVPDSVSLAVDAMRQANTDEALVLHRAWWLLSK